MSEREPSQDPFAPIIRNRGCWNCRHWDNQDKARAFWAQRRQADLAYALQEAHLQPEGEDHSKVVSIRRVVDQVDHAMAIGAFGICQKGKAQADLVHNAYLCDGWSAAAGASLVTSGTAPDLLPEELRALRDGKPPTGFENRQDKKKEDNS